MKERQMNTNNDVKSEALSVMGSGKLFSFDNPQVEAVDIEDIALSLSRIPRWNGHMIYSSEWSVMNHPIMVMHIVKSQAKYESFVL